MRPCYKGKESSQQSILPMVKCDSPSISQEAGMDMQTGDIEEILNKSKCIYPH